MEQDPATAQIGLEELLQQDSILVGLNQRLASVLKLENEDMARHLHEEMDGYIYLTRVESEYVSNLSVDIGQRGMRVQSFWELSAGDGRLCKLLLRVSDLRHDVHQWPRNTGIAANLVVAEAELAAYRTNLGEA
jgi:hypothetical protein